MALLSDVLFGKPIDSGGTAIHTRRDAVIGVALAMICGWCLLFYPRGRNWWFHGSYNISSLLAGTKALTNDVVIVQMDQASSVNLNVNWSDFPARSQHARLIHRLRESGCKLIVLDVWLELPAQDPTWDRDLEAELKQTSNIVLAAVVDPTVPPSKWVATRLINPPATNFARHVPDRIGNTQVKRDSDWILREHYWPEQADELVPLPWLVADLAGVSRAQSEGARLRQHWVRYYGGRGTIQPISYWEALNARAEMFTNKIVFVGSVPQTESPKQTVDVYATPFSDAASGVEVQATMYLNLARGDWLRMLSPFMEFLIVTLLGVVAGAGLVRLRPIMAALAFVAGTFGIVILTTLLVSRYNTWFPWMVIVAGELPCALLWSGIVHTQRLERELKDEKSKSKSKRDESTFVLPQPAADGQFIQAPDVPIIRGHLLLKIIGEGGFGKVWLARNEVGMFEALKVVTRTKFHNQLAPYEREFRGVRRFMPISRDHANFVQILEVGRRDEEGFFYYVMEAGDDEQTAQDFHVTSYTPRNLANEIRRRGRLPVLECLEIMVPLTSAIERLHQQRLIHRDIKPSNVIFVKGVPKLADIGLVTDMRTAGDVSLNGTEYYMPAEGPGAATGDIYSVGKVLYVISTGQPVDNFPDLPDSLDKWPDRAALLSLNDIFTKAGAEKADDRHQTMGELRGELLALRKNLAEPERQKSWQESLRETLGKMGIR